MTRRRRIRWFWKILAILVLLGTLVIVLTPKPATPSPDCEADACYFDLEE